MLDEYIDYTVPCSMHIEVTALLEHITQLTEPYDSHPMRR